jgi:dihydrofolate reductase
LRRFKTITMGAPMIMGRKTFDSLPGLLPGRRHIVLTRDTAWEEEGAEVVHSVEAAIKIANAPHVWVIGGAEIYALFAPIADRIELTEVHATPDGDASVAAFGEGWKEVVREPHNAENGSPAFDFVTLKRDAV